MITELHVDIIGWSGAILVLVAYAMVSSAKLTGDDLRYQILNLFGSIFLLINAFYHHALPSSVVNVIWIMIAIYMLVRIMKRNK